MALWQRGTRGSRVIVILLLVFLFLATVVVAFDPNRFPPECIDPFFLTVGNAAVAGNGLQEGPIPTAATMAVDAAAHHMFTGHAHPPDSPAPSLVGGQSIPLRLNRPQRSPPMSSFLNHVPTWGVVVHNPDHPSGQYDAGPSTAPLPSPSINATSSVTDVEIIPEPPLLPPGDDPPKHSLTRDLFGPAGRAPDGMRCPDPACEWKSRLFYTWRTYHKHAKEHRKLFQCRIKCERWFGYESKRLSHERSCGNTREFACTTCGRRFNRNDMLKRHMTNSCVQLHQ